MFCSLIERVQFFGIRCALLVVGCCCLAFGAVGCYFRLVVVACWCCSDVLLLFVVGYYLLVVAFVCPAFVGCLSLVVILVLLLVGSLRLFAD